MLEVIETARAAYRAGLCVVPPKQDGSKCPAVSTWTAFQKERPSNAQMRTWYGPSTGIGLITGAISKNLEMFEFDCRDTYDAFMEVARQSGLEGLVSRLESGYVEDTPAGGVHWLYYCDEIGRNIKLAGRPKRLDEQKDEHDKWKTLIETRGEGGYVIIAPSCGTVHPTGRPYILRGGGIDTIPRLTPDERNLLMQLARTFDATPPQAPRHAPPTKLGDGDRPGDVFSARASWADILTPAGWTRVYARNETDYWRRPGKREGISATTNFGGSDYLIVFSSSTPFEPGRAYSKFSAYARLYHNDDHRAAALDLMAKGFGSKPVATGTLPESTDQRPMVRHISDVVTDVLDAYDKGRPQFVATPYADLNWLFCGGMAPGELIYLGARPGVGKTAMALEIARAAAKHAPVLFVSREMVDLALARRMLAQEGRISASRLRQHQLFANEMSGFSVAMERLSALDLWITDEAHSLGEIVSLVASPPSGVPWKLLIVDYLQLVHAPSDVKDRRLQVEAVSQGLKDIATDYNMPVLVLSSLRRPAQGNPRPTLADLRESGELEHDADIIMLLHRPDTEPTATMVECWIDKNRSGETGRVNFMFSREFVSFAQMERGA